LVASYAFGAAATGDGTTKDTTATAAEASAAYEATTAAIAAFGTAVGAACLDKPLAVAATAWAYRSWAACLGRRQVEGPATCAFGVYFDRTEAGPLGIAGAPSRCSSLAAASDEVAGVAGTRSAAGPQRAGAYAAANAVASAFAAG
jgi:hypothetical protein